MTDRIEQRTHRYQWRMETAQGKKPELTPKAFTRLLAKLATEAARSRAGRQKKL